MGEKHDRPVGTGSTHWNRHPPSKDHGQSPLRDHGAPPGVGGCPAPRAPSGHRAASTGAHSDPEGLPVLICSMGRGQMVLNSSWLERRKL